MVLSFILIKDLKSIPLQNNNEESISRFWRHFKDKPAEIILPIFYSPQLLHFLLDVFESDHCSHRLSPCVQISLKIKALLYIKFGCQGINKTRQTGGNKSYFCCTPIALASPPPPTWQPKEAKGATGSVWHGASRWRQRTGSAATDATKQKTSKSDFSVSK